MKAASVSEIVEVLAHGTDPDTGTPVRRVRLADGSVVTQYGDVTVSSAITRADGTVQPGAAVTGVQITGG
jgi:hypothetical protein